MPAAILDGRAIASRVLREVAERVQSLTQKGVNPAAVFVLIGESEEGRLYASRLRKTGEKVGVAFSTRELPAEAAMGMLDREVAALNADPAIDGILVELPLPPHLSARDVASIIDPRKDVDGVTIQNAGRLHLGYGGHPPSTASALLEILTASEVPLRGKHAVVVGRSNVVGRPVAELLLQKDCTVTLAHSRTAALADVCRQADILVVATGQLNLVAADMVKPGAVVLDAGINVTEDGVRGDVDFEGCLEVASAITPVPGGVGPVTNAILLRNVVVSAEQRAA